MEEEVPKSQLKMHEIVVMGTRTRAATRKPSPKIIYPSRLIEHDTQRD